MSSENPYIGRGAPVSGLRLVGREESLKRLVSRINNHAHCSIVGLPRIGKTSLAREAVRLSKHSKLSIPYITLDALRNPTQAFHRIIYETHEDDVSEWVSYDDSVSHDSAYEEFVRVFRYRRRSGRSSVVIVDEFDSIARKEFEDAQLFISRLREVANDRDRYGLTFIFVSRRSLDMIQGVVDCSTLAGLCEVVYLKPLNYAGLVQLRSRSTKASCESTDKLLWEFTGGHPYLAEVVMCEAEEDSCLELTVKALDRAQELQAHEFTNQYQQLESLLSLDNLFDSLCELTLGPRWRDIPPHSSAILYAYGIISRDNEDQQCNTFSSNFRAFLTLRDRIRPTWELIGETERQLRTLIEDQLTELFGVNWLEKLIVNNPQLRTALDKMFDQRSRERKLFGDAASDMILDYAYFGDLKSIIFAEWDLFRSVLGGTKADWNRKFEDVIKVRNPLAHYRVIAKVIVYDAEKACKAILATLTRESMRDV